MKEPLKKFILQLLIVSVALYVILYFVFREYEITNMPVLIMIALLFALNAVAYILITNTREKRPAGFVYSYMGISFGRLIICSIFVFSFALTHRQNARTFALTFFLLYFIYTTIEVRGIYTYFKK